MSQSESEPVVVVATIQPREGREADVEAALLDAVAKVHGEEGCLLYALHRTHDAPPRFVMLEKWTSAAALDAHTQGEVLAELGGRLDGAVVGPPEVLTLAAAPGGDAERGAL